MEERVRELTGSGNGTVAPGTMSLGVSTEARERPSN